MCKEEKTYRAYNLLLKYFPNTLSLIDKKYDFSILDKRYDKLLENDALNNYSPRETNIIDFTIYCEQNNLFHIKLAKFLDDLVKEAIDTLSEEHKKGLRNAFKGKFTNFSSWNYLNPFGEIISLLTILKSDNYKLLEIEHKIPNGRSIDFLFTTDNNSKIAVEVINFHPEDTYNNISELEKHFMGKLEKKIGRESENIQFDMLQFTWTYLPVLWSTDLKSLLNYKEFFENMEKTTVKVKDKEIFILGFTSFIQHIDDYTGNRFFEFGYVTKLFNKLSEITSASSRPLLRSGLNESL